MDSNAPPAENPDSDWDVIERAIRRITSLVAWILHTEFPRVKDEGIASTLDIVHSVAVRLKKALEEVDLKDTNHLANLAAKHARWVLLDICKEIGERHLEPDQAPAPIPAETMVAEPTGSCAVDSRRRERLEHLASRVGDLSDKLKHVVELKFFLNCTHKEVAKELRVTTKTVQRRWRKAKETLYDNLIEKFPELDCDGE